ncbi:MAG: hypothetical protein AAF349_20185 [Cyanobacteria bacterium P01_A01_bin.68]
MMSFTIPLTMSYVATASVREWLGLNNLPGIKRAEYISIGKGLP